MLASFLIRWSTETAFIGPWVCRARGWGPGRHHRSILSGPSGDSGEVGAAVDDGADRQTRVDHVEGLRVEGETLSGPGGFRCVRENVFEKMIHLQCQTQSLLLHTIGLSYRHCRMRIIFRCDGNGGTKGKPGNGGTKGKPGNGGTKGKSGKGGTKVKPDIKCPSDMDDAKCSKTPQEMKKDEKLYCFISEFASDVNNDCRQYKLNDSNDQLLLNMSGEIDQIMGDMGMWENMEKDLRRNSSYLLMGALENAMYMTAVNLDKERYNLTMENFEIEMQVLKDKEINVNGTVTLLANENQMEFHWETQKSEDPSEFAAISFLACKTLGSLLEVNELEMANKKFGKESLQMNSNLLMAVMTTTSQELQNITFTIKNNEEDADDYTVCVYLREADDRIFWSTQGCSKLQSTRSHTTCRCSHLSKFAVLVALYKVEGPALSVITYVGVIISLVALLAAIITFTACRSIHSARTRIHTHLCLCLFLAQLLFLVGISRTENKAVCGTIAGILHYLFLACFMWMLLEGVQLYLMVVKVFHAQSLRGKITFPVAYGIPALLVVVSAASYPQGYGTREYCWLTLDKGFRWSFVGPMCVICVANLVFLTVTIWKLIEKFKSISPDLPYLEKIRVFIVTAIAQLAILGCAWIIGVFHFNRRTIALAYIFTVLNSFQGTFIFILHCVNNKQVRSEYRQWMASLCQTLKISKYSTFTESTQPTSTSHVASSATSV
ncbi:adhesion G protein-coupled receptor E3-like [Amblyraja radiata]|uniref:adhesion G protein-coupled receptor E3-like n=1 Tax=Amblyraja radiata TaxID=386614 RepID=UPI0014030292|nr:adhesion G protein-coupled receptor E3-like [Amblyraja radiata]